MAWRDARNGGRRGTTRGGKYRYHQGGVNRHDVMAYRAAALRNQATSLICAGDV